jgi:hypothetical protein
VDSTVTHVITTGLGLLGGGVIKAALDHWAKLRGRRLQAEIEGEAFPRKAYADARADHAACVERVSKVEAAMFRHEAKAQACAEENEAMKAQISNMRDALLAAFLGDKEAAVTLLTPPDGMLVPSSPPPKG